MLRRRSPGITAYHLILSAYGFWLPNDPRGSWSDFVRAWELLRFGPATKVNDHRSVARKPHDRRLRLAAKKALSHEPVIFTGQQARAIGQGFSDYCRKSNCLVHACAVMLDHAHLLVARGRLTIERIATLLKGAASTQLLSEGLHPFQDRPYRNGRLPSPWARKGWKCFLNPSEIPRVIEYVEKNPEKEGLPAQRWHLVTPFVPESR